MTTEQSPALLSDLARRHAAAMPASPAIVGPDGVWTWSELDHWADVIAGQLRSTGLGAEDRVGLAVGPTAHGVAGLHAVARAGITAVLLHPRLAGPEVDRLLAISGCRLVLQDPSVDLSIPAGIRALRITDDDRRDPARGPVTPARPPVDSTAVLVVPTSGTTARPKLACLPLDRIAASATAWDAFLPPATGWLLSLGLTHVAGIGIVARAAAQGVPVVVPSAAAVPALLDALEAARRQGSTVSHLSLVATQLEAILDATGDAPPPPGIVAVILGGGPVPESLVHRAIDARWPVIPSYGMTETSSGVVALPSGEAASHAGTVGLPLPGVELRIDADERIGIRGQMVFADYLDDPTATADVLDGHGWFSTSDRGRLDADGRLTVLGRIDDVIITGGENVDPSEIESVLREHPGIADVAVAGVPDPTWGAVPVALVVAQAGADPSADDLRAFCRARLARYKVPARFVRASELPRTALGKVIRSEVAALVLGSNDPAPVRRPTPGPADATRRIVALAGGQRIAIKDIGPAGTHAHVPVVVLLHATLSTSDQLLGLVRRLSGRARVIAIDRRGSGDSPMPVPGPVPVERHAADVLEVLAGLGIERTVLFGHSFGGVVGLRVAVAGRARAPGLISALAVWEPPYLALATPAIRDAMTAMTTDVVRAYASDGPAAAAQRFLEGVAGPDAWDRLHPRQRTAVGREGHGVLADVTMDGLTTDGLAAITCPAIVATGTDSQPMYRPIADALAALIGSAARRVDLPGMAHLAPITNPDVVADLVLGLLDDTATSTPTPTPTPTPPQESSS